MDDKTQIVIMVVIVLIGVGLGFHAGRHSSMQHAELGNEVMHQPDSSSRHDSMNMNEMIENLKGKSGNEFEKAFLESMIVHHEGAIEMARLIPENSIHTEMNQLGYDIITAQTKEIIMMKQWLKDWGYKQE